MDKNNLTAGIIITIAVVLGVGLWFWGTFPKKAEISVAVNPPKAIDVNVLKGDTAQKIQKRDKNGNIPVVVGAGDVGREDPFSNF